jgi:hypothetical protein
LAALLTASAPLGARAEPGVSTSTAARTSTAAPDVGTRLLNTGARMASAALGGDVQEVLDVLPAPSPALAATMAAMALTRWGRRSGVNAGGFNLVADLVFWAGAVALPVLYVMPLFGDEVSQPLELRRTVELDSRIYLLTYDKSSPLTGAFQREPSGLGLGYDFALRYNHPTLGLLAGGELTFQESEIAGNTFVDVTGFFVKLDLKVGIDLARLAGELFGWDALLRHRLTARIGPSVFHNWVISAEDRGAFNFEARDPTLNDAVGLATGLGWEAIAELDVDLGWLGGLNVLGQVGQYPLLSFAEPRGDDAALLVLIGFDDLRGGDSYEWQRLIVTLDLPFFGFSQDGTLSVGGQLSRLEAGTGAAVDNRGLSVGGSWRW